MTTYSIVYKISNRVKMLKIDAASPMLAFKKFKQMMPDIIYKNLSVQEIELDKESQPKKQNLKSCFECNFDIKKIA